MKQFLIFLFCLSVSANINSQELDDMYYTGSDRSSQKKLKNKVSPADIILSKYRKGNTSINNNSSVDETILDRYKSNKSNNINYSKSQNETKKLKYNRDNLYVSSDISKSLTDYNLYSSFLPYYYTYNDPFSVIDPYSSMFYNMNSYDMMIIPRNISGIRSIASLNPMLFFSNPYIVTFDPRLSPALINLHYPSIQGFGLGCSLYKHGSWMFTSNGTGGGLGHTITNRHLYVSGVFSKSEKIGTRGPRSGRLSSMNGENIENRNFIPRRQSGITNQNISKDSREGRGQTFGNVSQNSIFRDKSPQDRGNIRTSSRSSRSSSLNSQNRRSLNNARSSSEKINGIREFSNSIRSSYSGSTRGLSNYSSADGRRSGYSAPPVSFNPVRGRGMSAPVRSSSYGGSSNSGGSYSSGGSGSSYSSGGSSGGSSGVVSGGSSGGSSRGGGRN